MKRLLTGRQPRPTPIPKQDTTPRLAAWTLAWLAEHPHARKMVRSVWDTLTALEQAGEQPETAPHT